MQMLTNVKTGENEKQMLLFKYIFYKNKKIVEPNNCNNHHGPLGCHLSPRFPLLSRPRLRPLLPLLPEPL